MNKKFSTLLVSLLLAGAWTTLDAAIVKTTPAIGGKYAIGTVVEGDQMKIWNISSMKVADAAEVTSDKVTFELEAVADKDGVYYLKSGDTYLQYAGTETDATGYLSFGVNGTKLQFKIEGGQLVCLPGVDTFNGKLHMDAEGNVRVPYPGYTMSADSKDLTFVVYNDDVKFAGENLPLQTTITANEYYVIAADGTHVLKADGTTGAMVEEAELDHRCR